MKTAMDVINETVRRHGLHKLSSRVLAAEGLPAPQDWTFGEVAATMGAKIAQDLINHHEVMGGITSLYEVAGDSGEKLARVDLFEEFSRVKNVRETVGKTASESVERELIGYEIGFWQRCKNAAANDHEGQHVGLAKIALSLYAATDTAGEKLASSVDDAIQFAASFASAAVVDAAIVSMVKSAEVTPAEGMKLAAINAQAAINDLKVMTKSAAPRWLTEARAMGARSENVEPMLYGAFGRPSNDFRDGFDHPAYTPPENLATDLRSASTANAGRNPAAYRHQEQSLGQFRRSSKLLQRDMADALPAWQSRGIAGGASPLRGVIKPSMSRLARLKALGLGR